MIRRGWSNRLLSKKVGVSTPLAIALLSAPLLSGCGESGAPLSDIYANYQPVGNFQRETPQPVVPSDVQPVSNWKAPPQSPEPRLAGMMPVAKYAQASENASAAVEDTDIKDTDFENSATNPTSDPSEKYWSFPSDETDGPLLSVPVPTALPPVEDEPLVISMPAAENGSDREEQQEEPVALLLAPQVVEQIAKTVEPVLPAEAAIDLTKPTEIDSQVLPTEPTYADTQAHTLPVLAELSEQEKLLNALISDSSSAATGVLTNARVDELAKSKIQEAYLMANRGALYLARQKMIEVLRLISQAKDAQQGTPLRSQALAAGLRALREAEDFSPHGTQLEAEMDTAVLCASHRTPLAKLPEAANVLPRLMMDRYLRYAQLQLSMSVAGEPAGSMALHALGKICCQLGHVESEANQLADRHAIAFQQAALLAHNQNYLAAHELAVLLANSGHYPEAEHLFLQVAAQAPNAVVHRNLANVQQRLGRTAQATTNREYAQRLAQHGASGTSNVQLVSPAAFANANAQAPRYRAAQAPATSQLPIPGQRRPQNTPQWR